MENTPVNISHLTPQQKAMYDQLPSWMRNFTPNNGAMNKPGEPLSLLGNYPSKNTPIQVPQQVVQTPLRGASQNASRASTPASTHYEVDVTKLDVDSMMDATTYAGVDLKVCLVLIFISMHAV